jgi:hypothetical protein
MKFLDGRKGSFIWPIGKSIHIGFENKMSNKIVGFPILRRQMTNMNVEQAVGKCVTLVVTNVENDDDVHVFAGLLQIRDGHYCFVNEEKGWRVQLDKEQLGRMRPVEGDLRPMLLGAEYYLPLTIGSLPENGQDEVFKTGLKWHNPDIKNPLNPLT